MPGDYTRRIKKHKQKTYMTTKCDLVVVAVFVGKCLKIKAGPKVIEKRLKKISFGDKSFKKFNNKKIE